MPKKDYGTLDDSKSKAAYDRVVNFSQMIFYVCFSMIYVCFSYLKRVLGAGEHSP
jgi:hypothetical protein